MTDYKHVKGSDLKTVTENMHAARVGEIASELNLAIRNAARDGVFFEIKMPYVGFSQNPTVNIPRINVKVK